MHDDPDIMKVTESKPDWDDKVTLCVDYPVDKLRLYNKNAFVDMKRDVARIMMDHIARDRTLMTIRASQGDGASHAIHATISVDKAIMEERLPIDKRINVDFETRYLISGLRRQPFGRTVKWGIGAQLPFSEAGPATIDILAEKFKNSFTDLLSGEPLVNYFQYRNERLWAIFRGVMRIKKIEPLRYTSLEQSMRDIEVFYEIKRNTL